MHANQQALTLPMRLCQEFMMLGLIFAVSIIALADIQSAEKAYQNKDYSIAFSEYKTLAESGNLEAQAKLGAMFYWGLGTKKSDLSAFRWSIEAAKKGHPEAQNLIGYMYEHGINVAKDISTAIDWYCKAVEQNHSASQANLARILLLSDEYPRDVERGFRLAKLAAEQDNAHGQYLVAQVYLTEHKDFEQAQKWFISAAEKGSYQAASLLGKFYFNGEPFAQDRSLSYFWFAIAEALGDPLAKDSQARAKGYLENTDIEKLDKEVKSWLRENQ